MIDVYADIANVTDDTEVLQLDAANSSSGSPTVQQDRINLTLPTIGLHAQF